MSNHSESIDEIRMVILQSLHQIAPEIDFQNISPDTILREEYEIDSMDFLRFIVLLHEKLKIDIPEKDYPRLATLKSSLTYLNEKINQH
ncbi:acyl carrier protein [Fluoribacter gormanii]|uniref:Acyl carrier protein n=1 Tax=Fluoribacter gormanii TaxID=464 RepID=A0A377GL52_9GAMM|nr:acyl carrier protein [Fluoribacter gormanii]KTD05352.1 acyl carrier protein [Fluoribacter gormanii]MCW8471544.1 acyl carrier protein [Fluoribacter gormanii]SIR63042.1 acyl carrier protein [Fluoribacter gormanii]STO25344.1 Acyl carrier protein [Fluoribacter gormanii]